MVHVERRAQHLYGYAVFSLYYEGLVIFLVGDGKKRLTVQMDLAGSSLVPIVCVRKL